MSEAQHNTTLDESSDLFESYEAISFQSFHKHQRHSTAQKIKLFI